MIEKMIEAWSVMLVILVSSELWSESKAFPVAYHVHVHNYISSVELSISTSDLFRFVRRGRGRGCMT